VINYNNGEILIELDLAHEIIAEESQTVASTRKLELKLKKKEETINWMNLEKGQAPTLMATQIARPGGVEVSPHYPSSS
jgi:hypothetical protein